MAPNSTGDRLYDLQGALCQRAAWPRSGSERTTVIQTLAIQPATASLAARAQTADANSGRSRGSAQSRTSSTCCTRANTLVYGRQNDDRHPSRDEKSRGSARWGAMRKVICKFPARCTGGALARHRTDGDEWPKVDCRRPVAAHCLSSHRSTGAFVCSGPSAGKWGRSGSASAEGFAVLAVVAGERPAQAELQKQQRAEFLDSTRAQFEHLVNQYVLSKGYLEANSGRSRLRADRTDGAGLLPATTIAARWRGPHRK